MKEREWVSTLVNDALAETISREIKNAYRAGFREAAGMYGKLDAIPQAYKEADMRAEAYLYERARDE